MQQSPTSASERLPPACAGYFKGRGCSVGVIDMSDGPTTAVCGRLHAGSDDGRATETPASGYCGRFAYQLHVWRDRLGSLGEGRQRAGARWSGSPWWQLIAAAAMPEAAGTALALPNTRRLLHATCRVACSGCSRGHGCWCDIRAASTVPWQKLCCHAIGSLTLGQIVLHLQKQHCTALELLTSSQSSAAGNMSSCCS